MTSYTRLLLLKLISVLVPSADDTVSAFSSKKVKSLRNTPLIVTICRQLELGLFLGGGKEFNRGY